MGGQESSEMSKPTRHYYEGSSWLLPYYTLPPYCTFLVDGDAEVQPLTTTE